MANMNPRRAPLREAPSSVLNSPLRAASTAVVGTKRVRSHGVDQREHVYQYGPPPHVKRQAVQADSGDPRGLLRKTGGNPPTALQRKLEAVRDARTAKSNASKTLSEENLENVRQWQRHYRKVFPSITFFFDSVPEPSRLRVASDVRSLGAHEEIFFSKAVTHVITTRPIPAAPPAAAAKTADRSPKQENVSGKTINPLLLDNQKGKFTFEAPMGKRLPTSNDMLVKAREMGMKIWSMEKLQRMLMTLLSEDTGERETIDIQATLGRPRGGREAELSQLLRNERRHMMADRDWMVDMMQFRGNYIYVHDMDEKTKPVMIRDYPKAATKEQGKWPQLRLNQPNRCPYLEDTNPRRTATEPIRPTVEQTTHRTRAATAGTGTTTHSKRVLAENANITGRSHSPAKPLDPPKNLPIKRGSTDNLPLFGSAQASLRKLPRFAQGEPVASGVQPSNITSAIRSQMISSTAAAPGAKAGSTRELNALKRKVLERNNAAGTAESNYMNNVRAAINDDTGRPNKRKALGDIVEEAGVLQKGTAPRKKRVVVKEAKPGYCENCRDKFDDFDEHIMSRTHRKFATSHQNFRELDRLILKLGRT